MSSKAVVLIVNRVKVKNGGEGTNCGFTLDPEVDWNVFRNFPCAPLCQHE
jgi:hypothetical protein